MDSYTIAIIGILILAIQALGVHSIFTLHVNEAKLRETIASQGRELIRLQEQLEAISQQPGDPVGEETVTTLDEPDESLEALIARYEQDEAESWRLLNQPTPGESTAQLTIN